MSRVNTGQFTKGHPGGPGRPRGSVNSVLTSVLRRVLSEKYRDYDTKTSVRDGREILTRIVTELALTGRATLADGTVMALDSDQYLRLLNFVFDRVDGRPAQAVDVLSGGEPLKLYVGWSPDEWDHNNMKDDVG